MPNIPSKLQKDPSITFWVILLTHRQTDKQTNKNWQNITSLAEVNMSTQCRHALCGRPRRASRDFNYNTQVRPFELWFLCTFSFAG